MKNTKIKQMVIIAILIALIFVLQFIGGMIPPVGGFSISLVLVPIVLGAALYGPAAGAVLGGAFGVITYINCATGADPLGALVFSDDPLLCFALVMGKGVLAGFTAGLIYKLLKGTKNYLAMLVAAVACPIVNTGVFLAGMLLLFQDILITFSAKIGQPSIGGFILSVIVLANFVPELIINVALSPATNRVARIVKN